MCGILGSINQKLTSADLSQIYHRGPDEQNLIQKDIAGQEVYLGHTRLSIVDLSSAGSQPMISDCGHYIIIFNGEIYNHQELRDRIKDVQFKGHSDTETILYYLRQNGSVGLKDFNGIFSLAFLDIQAQKLLIARDQFGVKPLYYYFKGGKLIFSSELRPIYNKIGNQSLNLANVYSLLRLRFSPSPQTLFEDISKVKPGHFLEISLAHMEDTPLSTRYAYLPGEKIKISEQEALEQYEHYLRKAIKRQLMSDVPISILLSGGVDSALLTKIAIEESGNVFDTYTAGYHDKTDIDEIDEARISASVLGTKHHEVLLNEEDFLNNLPDFINIIEEPLGSQSIFPMYYLSQQIHGDDFKVALSGQGVDEPWGGYPKYNPQNIIGNFSLLLGGVKSIRKLTKHDQYRRLLNAMTSKGIVERFIEVNSVFDASMMSKLIRQERVITEGEQALKRLYKERLSDFVSTTIKPVDSLMYFDARMNLADDLLAYTDKISMNHSLELRVPFLDVDLVRFVESLPSKYKVTINKNKILHKKFSEKYLPEEIVYRKKKHFATPRKSWFKGKVGKEFEAMLMDDKGIFSEFFNREEISKLFNKHRDGLVNYEKQLYLLISLGLWGQKYS